MDDVAALVTTLAGTPWALLVLFGLAVLDGFFPPVPSEIALVALVVSATSVDDGSRVLVAVVVAVTGAVCGDVVAHLIGRSVGTARLAHRFPRLRRPLTGAAHAFADHGPVLLVSARFVPGWRVAVTMSSGVVGMPWRRFLAVDLVSAGLWGLLTGGLAAVSGTLLAQHPLAATAVGVVVGTLTGAVLGRIMAARRRTLATRRALEMPHLADRARA